MTITVLMVAEKPSLAASIAQHLSGGKVNAFLPWRLARQVCRMWKLL